MESFAFAPCVYFVTKDDGILHEINDFACCELQYTRAEIVGYKIEKFLTVASKIFYQTHFFPLLRLNNIANEIYITLQKKDGGHLPVLLNAERKILEGVELNLFVGIIVHNRKKFEDELIAAKKAAEKSAYENRELLLAKQELHARTEELDNQIYLVKKHNEELRQFNKVITHDMQEPLRKISFYTSSLIQMPEKFDRGVYISKIYKVSNQMRDIISGLQQYVWLDEASIQINKVDLTSILNSVKQKLLHEFPGIELEVEISRLLDITVNYEQFQILLYHLLSNAIRFRKDIQHVSVKIEMNMLQKNQFRSVEDKYKYVEFVRLRFIDQGIGFNQEWANQVFDLFRKLHPESGRGLGLSICKKIVDNHKGMISIESKVNKGTIVTIDLPYITMI
jgi:sigma-B regulation protein RsbU (phosphoserine phosphatase)